jgi:hypothetical protein
VTAKMLPWSGGLDRRAYGETLPTDRRSVACARPVRRGKWRRAAREDSKEPRGVGAWGRHGLGRRATSLCVASGADAEGARARGRGVAARGAGRHEIVLMIPCLSTHNSKFFNRSVPTDEYESCRSSYPLPLSRRLYCVFFNRFCRRGLPTLNATQLP